MEKGALIGHPVQGIRVVLQDGQTHTVDSSDMAFRFAAMMAVRESILKAGAQVLEPIMSVEVSKIACRNCSYFFAGCSETRDFSLRTIMHFRQLNMPTPTRLLHARWLNASHRCLRNCAWV